MKIYQSVELVPIILNCLLCQKLSDPWTSQDRLALLNKSHVTEITQKTRLQLENGEVSDEELEKSIQVRLSNHGFPALTVLQEFSLMNVLLHGTAWYLGISIFARQDGTNAWWPRLDFVGEMGMAQVRVRQ